MCCEAPRAQAVIKRVQLAPPEIRTVNLIIVAEQYICGDAAWPEKKIGGRTVDMGSPSSMKLTRRSAALPPGKPIAPSRAMLAACARTPPPPDAGCCCDP